ncbi:unnamed protein product [Polarella glacialis]|uniref:Reverse transcriptase domain-containing protein n=1 Tax=Polarella glacialis TaxID=89957 RepID=A0A813KU91_POLGL|nr:unnamed protein product [Polarella glacialis]
MHKRWSPSVEEQDLYLERLRCACSGGQVACFEEMSKAIVSSAMHVKPKSSAFRDSPVLKSMCARRNAMTNRLEKDNLSREIIRHRKDERKAWTHELVIAAASGPDWSKHHILQEIDRKKQVRQMPRALSTPLDPALREKDHEKWPGMFADLYDDIFQWCHGELHDERVNLKKLRHALDCALSNERLDGRRLQLITQPVLFEAQSRLKRGKAVGNDGVVAEALLYLGSEPTMLLLELFNLRAFGKLAAPDSWKHTLTVLIPKVTSACSVDQFRPIAVVAMLQKLYMRCLLALVEKYIMPKGDIQHGNRRHYQTTEVIQFMRLVTEKCLEWGRPCVIVSLDVKKAFDRLKPSAIAKLLEKRGVPLHLRHAIMQELLDDRSLDLRVFDFTCRKVRMMRGVRQGSPESALFFSAVINDALTELSLIWKREDVGMHFGKFGGDEQLSEDWFLEHDDVLGARVLYEDIHVPCVAFAEDMYLIARSHAEAERMLRDVSEMLIELGLELQVSKTKWIKNKHISATVICHGTVEIPVVDSLVVLGSALRGDTQETITVEHRIEQAWKCFHKWSRLLLCKEAPFASRVSLWQRTVQVSLLWGLQTIRQHKTIDRRLRTTQLLMFRKMRGMGRNMSNENETWLAWQKRTFRELARWVDGSGTCVVPVLNKSKLSWVRHLARFGCGVREIHVVKRLLLWRPLSWWRKQQQAIADGRSAWRHPARFKTLRYEEQFPSNWLDTVQF